FGFPTRRSNGRVLKSSRGPSNQKRLRAVFRPHSQLQRLRLKDLLLRATFGSSKVSPIWTKIGSLKSLSNTSPTSLSDLSTGFSSSIRILRQDLSVSIATVLPHPFTGMAR